MKYNLVSVGGESNITVFVNGEMFTADQDHPNFKRIVESAVNDDESIVDLFDVARTIEKNFERLSDRITLRGQTLYVDSEPVNNALAQQIIRFLDHGQDFSPLVNFYEKLLSNPNEHSREQLYRWLNTHDFTITDDGDIVAYKGVLSGPFVGDGFTSVSTGPAIVNGKPVNGHVPQPIGGIVEMARGDVEFDPGQGCSVGLHAGTWDYASNFAPVVIEVHINPRDVVSVPTDCSDQKMRVCRYRVIDRVTSKYSVPVVLSSGYDNDLVKLDALDGSAAKWDTRQNHTRQRRGPNGRFLKS